LFLNVSEGAFDTQRNKPAATWQDLVNRKCRYLDVRKPVIRLPAQPGIFAMSSIMSATAMPQSFSPLSRLQSELASEVSSGAISSGDQSALSSALSDIDTALKSQAPSAGSRPSPDAMKSKIDDLIAGEVKDGKLTSAQADELKNVFAKTFQGGPGGAGGPGGPGGADSDGDSDGSSSTSSTQSSTDSDVSKLLTDFLKLIKDSQGSKSTYSSSGDSLASQIQSLIVNYQA
jgi:hypothetical protein